MPSVGRQPPRQRIAKKIANDVRTTETELEITLTGRPTEWAVTRAKLVEVFDCTTGQFPILKDAGVAVPSAKKGYYLLRESLLRLGAYRAEDILAPPDEDKYKEKLNSTQERARLHRAQRARIEMQTRQMVGEGLSIDAMNDFLMAIALIYVKALEDIPARLVMVQGASGRDAARIKQLCENEVEQIRRLVLSRFDEAVSGIAEKIDAVSGAEGEIDSGTLG